MAQSRSCLNAARGNVDQQTGTFAAVNLDSLPAQMYESTLLHIATCKARNQKEMICDCEVSNVLWSLYGIMNCLQKSEYSKKTKKFNQENVNHEVMKLMCNTLRNSQNWILLPSLYIVDY